MTSTRPYLIRAFFEWILENGCTPHVVVDATAPGVVVPKEHVDSGQIVLNIAGTAVKNLLLGNEVLEFQARFGGQVRQIYAPIPAVLAIYAKENGRGMVFAEEDADDEPQLPPPNSPTSVPSDGANKEGGKKESALVTDLLI